MGLVPQESELLRHRDEVSRRKLRAFCWIARQDVADLLPHADVFWIGSEYEGQSNAVIEAMQAGLPVVASDIPGNRDLVIQEETGLFFPLGDTAEVARQTRRVLEDPNFAKRLGDAAQKRIQEEFSVELMVERHAQLYQQFAAKS